MPKLFFFIELTLDHENDQFESYKPCFLTGAAEDNKDNYQYKYDNHGDYEED